jgi:hypothetical protein
MSRRAVVLIGAALAVYAAADPPSAQAPAVVATRLAENPLLTVATSRALGDNVNGPTVVRVPDWIDRPLGRYYMYLAHHKGEFIRLAYADRLEGPWKVHAPGVLHVRDTAFHRPQPDPPDSPEGFYTHVASPEILVDAPGRRLVMWFHGWWTEGQRWPSAPEAREWARTRGFGQYTQVAESTDGIRFQVRPSITQTSYLRVFREGAQLYGLARLGRLGRATDPFVPFELGPSVFRDGLYAGRVRHVALLRRGRTLYVFFTAIGDAPERVLMSTIDLSGDWSSWRASAPIEVLRPNRPYECVDAPLAPSEAGDVEGRVRQIRDPYVFEENGRIYLFYTICGEQGIAAAEIALGG